MVPGRRPLACYTARFQDRDGQAVSSRLIFGNVVEQSGAVARTSRSGARKDNRRCPRNGGLLSDSFAHARAKQLRYSFGEFQAHRSGCRGRQHRQHVVAAAVDGHAVMAADRRGNLFGELAQGPRHLAFAFVRDDARASREACPSNRRPSTALHRMKRAFRSDLLLQFPESNSHLPRTCHLPHRNIRAACLACWRAPFRGGNPHPAAGTPHNPPEGEIASEAIRLGFPVATVPFTVGLTVSR